MLTSELENYRQTRKRTALKTSRQPSRHLTNGRVASSQHVESKGTVKGADAARRAKSTTQ
jgi:hypothetical protein